MFASKSHQLLIHGASLSFIYILCNLIAERYYQIDTHYLVLSSEFVVFAITKLNLANFLHESLNWWLKTAVLMIKCQKYQQIAVATFNLLLCLPFFVKFLLCYSIPKYFECSDTPQHINQLQFDTLYRWACKKIYVKKTGRVTPNEIETYIEATVVRTADHLALTLWLFCEWTWSI